MNVEINMGLLIIGIIGSVFGLLIAIIGFGIRGTLARMEGQISKLFEKFDTAMTKAACAVEHANHDKIHKLEGTSNNDRFYSLKVDIDGVGKRVDAVEDRVTELERAAS